GAGVVRTSWGRYVQSERPYELRVEDGETRLGPAERSAQWDLGYERPLRGRVSLALHLFRQHLDATRARYENLLDPFAAFPEARPDRVRLEPSGSVARGLELLLRGGSGDRRLGWWLAYTWSHADDRVGVQWVPRPLDERHSVVADLDWRPSSRWDLNLAW